MKRRGPLKGQAPANLYRARSGDGKDIDLGYAIFPIVSQHENGTFVPIGTGFFVAEQGIFITAAHVVTAVLDQQGNATAPFGIFQFLPDGQYCIRQIHRATRHLVADVAVGVAIPMNHRTTGAPMPNNILQLSKCTPSLGSKVCTYAYPKTTVLSGTQQSINFQPGFFDGTLLQHFPQGRDRVILPGPCFETSIVIHGGASGGPVIGPNGAVFAINSTSIDEEPISYVSCISTVFDLEITDIKLPGDDYPRTTTLRELVDRGFVKAR